MESTENFVYEPLDLARPTIRVVKILPGPEDSTIRCELKHIELNDDSHVCLSYMCGSSDTRETILVNDKHFTVLPNLAAFLNKARKLRIMAWLWIDAISIHQSDNKERSKQVQQMAEIYQRARSVLVWLEDWRENEAKSIRRAISSFSWFPRNFERNRLLRAAFEASWKHAFHTIAEVGYFDRTWIIQELLLSTSRLVIIGNRILGWNRFALFVQDVTKYCGDGKGSPRASMVCFFTITKSTLNIVDLMMLSRQSLCTERRDRLFGIMGLLDPAGRFPGIDYERPISHVLIDALGYFLPMIDPPDLEERIPYLLFSLKRALEVGCLTRCEACLPANLRSAGEITTPSNAPNNRRDFEHLVHILVREESGANDDFFVRGPPAARV